MNQFDDIRPFNDEEILTVLQRIIASDDCLNLIIRLHFGLLSSYFSFILRPLLRYRLQLVSKKIHSLKDFQSLVAIYLEKILDKTTNGVTILGLENLDLTKPALFISNHRDIALDSSIVNYALYTNGADTVRSATGDNLMTKPFVSDLFRANKCFIVKRNLSGPRELLKSLKKLSSYIYHSLKVDEQKVWIAQREGRTKDGNDFTQKGVLKMLTLAEKEGDAFSYFEKIKLVPVSISYEYDPTDVLKMPELLAKARDEKYIKSENEDFLNLLRGIIGTKKRIHIQVNAVLDQEIKEIAQSGNNLSEKLNQLCRLIDLQIWNGFKLWPSNFIAHDLLYGEKEYSDEYTEEEKTAFENRFKNKIDTKDPDVVKNFLSMYANPVNNQKKALSEI